MINETMPNDFKTKKKTSRYFRLFDETKAQYEVEKTKLSDEISALKESNQKQELENQHFKMRITEQNAMIDSQKEKIW